MNNFMNNLSLKGRVVFVGLIPLLFFVGTILYFVNENYTTYKEATSLTTKMDTINLSSQVINETQKERGMTASFLNGGATLSDLGVQRSINDGKIKEFKNVLAKSTFDESYKRDLLSLVANLGNLRNRVTSKSIPLGAALQEYTGIVSGLLDVVLDVADNTSMGSFAAGLRTFRIIEDSKESGGKLRANMAAILAKNTPITNGKFNTILNLKAGVDTGLKSSGLVINDKSKNLIKQFSSSTDWKEVNSIFQLILKNADQGEYNKDSGEFFKTISNALGIIGSLVQYQKEQLSATVVSEKSNALSALWRLTLLAAGIFVFAIVIMFLTANKTSNEILKIVSELSSSSNAVEDTSVSIAGTSTLLSEAATQQASSLQETVSSIDEISSMVQKNSESATAYTKVSAKSAEAANLGKDKIEDMMISIQDISDSNDTIMTEMERNNEEITKIIGVISLIGEKTKVINDIVFQTKLLSFNASVEAARAGEHGKGFAVVAEEVGNLASMSGTAALEISEMLESSIKQVTDIVHQSKGQIEALVNTGKEKVESGKDNATSCRDAIDEIMVNVNSVNEMLNEIATASNEQAAGIKEVTVAMQQLDQVTHQNTASAQDSSNMAISLSSQAKNLSFAVTNLTQLVHGHKGSSTAPLSPNHMPAVGNTENVLSIESKKAKAPINVPEATPQKKVSGSDVTMPSENDPRFEDL